MDSNIKFIPLGTIKNSCFFLSFQLLRDVTITCKHFDVYNTAFMLYSLYSCSYSTPSKSSINHFGPFYCFLMSCIFPLILGSLGVFRLGGSSSGSLSSFWAVKIFAQKYRLAEMHKMQPLEKLREIIFTLS